MASETPEQTPEAVAPPNGNNNEAPDQLGKLPINGGKVDSQFNSAPPKIEAPRNEPAQRVEGKPLKGATMPSGK